MALENFDCFTYDFLMEFILQHQVLPHDLNMVLKNMKVDRAAQFVLMLDRLRTEQR